MFVHSHHSQLCLMLMNTTSIVNHHVQRKTCQGCNCVHTDTSIYQLHQYCIHWVKEKSEYTYLELYFQYPITANLSNMN